MKRLMAVFLTAMLLLSCSAFAGGVNANLGRDVQEKYGEYISGGAVCGDTLYLMGYQNIFKWKIGEPELTPMSYWLEQPGENRYADLRNIFSNGDSLYGLMQINYSGPESYYLEECRIVELIPGEEEVSFGDSIDVDISELTVDYGGGAQMVQVNSICAQGDYACMQVYDMNGSPAVYCMDITTGAGFYTEAENAEMVTTYADGCFLIACYDYMNGEMRLQSFDPEAESLTEAAAPISMESYFSGMVYSQESDRLFFQRGGYVYAVTDFDFENAQQVAELSTQYGGNQGGLLLPGDVYVFSDYETTAVRSTQPGDLPETQLVVSDFTYTDAVMDAYYAFGNLHGDVAVVISRDYTQDSKVIEAMMNRDSTVDVYVMSVSQQAYNALFERGYMLDLSMNESIRTAVEAMYPGIRRAVMRDGEVVAVPVQTYGWAMGVNPDALEALGLTYDEIPRNWPDFLDFLVELPEMLPEDESVRVFESYMIQSDVKYNLRNSIMEEYQMWLNDVGLEKGYDTPELRTMLEKVMDIDYSIFGLPEEYEEDEGGVMWIYDDSKQTLFSTGIGCTIGNFYSGQLPLLLSVSPEYEPHLPMELSVAFVNPFSEHPELAAEFIAEMYARVPVSTTYNFSDALNEPIRSRYYEENMQNMLDSIAEMEKQLETAEAVDVPLLEESIGYMKQALEENEKYWWEISPESIEWFRSWDENIAVQQFNYLYADGSGEIWELTSQFVNGMIDLDTYIKSIDRKATMMAMEGN